MQINFQFFLYFFLCLLLFFLIYYIPGEVLLFHFFSKLKSKIHVAFAVGIAMWVLQSYTLSYLGLRTLSWLYIAINFLLFLEIRRKISLKIDKLKSDKILIFIVILGSIFQLMAVFPSGIMSSRGIAFYDINAYDGLYYLGLDKNLVSHIPPIEPGFSGHTLANYYFFSNLAVADVGRMFSLPLILLQFQAFPLMTTILFGLLTYEVGVRLSRSRNVGRLFSFLAYFGSDVGFLTSAALLGKLSVSNLQSIDRATLLLTNMPRALSLVVFLSGLLLLIEFLRSKKAIQFFLSGIIIASTIGFKIYTGILSGIIVGVTALVEFIKTKNLKIILSLIIVGIIAFLIYYPTNSRAGGLVWAPFAWPRHYFASTALTQIQWHLKEDFYRVNNDILNLIILYIKYIIIFLLTIFGTRIVGLLALKPINKESKFIHYLIYFSTLALILLGLLFLQKSGIYNTFNFFSVAALTLSFLTALFIGKISNKNVFRVAVSVIVILTLPRPIADFWGQAKSVYVGGGYIISNTELEALSFIKEKSPKNSLVLVGPNNSQDFYSPYVEFFSERATFLSNLFILESHNQPIVGRKNIVESIFSSKSKDELLSKLRQNEIDLLYLKLPLAPSVNYNYSGDEVFFKNDEIIVVKS